MESFEDMLNFLYSNMESNESTKLVLSRPILDKSSGKSIWKNTKAYLISINRNPDHFLNFMNKETNGNSNWVSSHKSDGMVFSINMKSDKLASLMQKYITNYVICKQCGNHDSVMERDTGLRKYKLVCNSCHSEHYLD